MTLEDLLCVFTYKPGWSFRLVENRLLIEFIAVDTDNHKETLSVSFVTCIPDASINIDWSYWLLRQIMEVEDHEAREFFKINGVKVFDPHA